MNALPPSLDIVGAGGFARQLLPMLEEQPGVRFRFIDDSPSVPDLCGYPVSCGGSEHGDAFVVAVSGGRARGDIATRMVAAGARPGRLVAKSARISSLAQIGEGTIACDYSVIEPLAVIGTHFHANVRAFVAHECRIGDFVTFGPGAICNGNVHIGDFAYVGAGAVIRQGTGEKPLSIGAGAVIGMGAVVTCDVPDGITVVGNPARPHQRTGS